MKLVMTLLVRDEADIIASIIDFHLDRGVDFIIAMDNLSVDGTTEILRSYEERGMLRYLHQSADDFEQGRWVTQMARLASTEHAADWVINADADEFWWPETGDLKTTIAACGDCDAIVAQRTNFPPRAPLPSGFFADVQTLRHTNSVNALGQPLPGKVAHRAYANVEVIQGNHAIIRDGHVLPTVPAPLTILHFPMRSYPQFANKIAKGGAAYQSNRNLPAETGKTWRELFDIWRRAELEQYFTSQVVDSSLASAMLASGELVHDGRLKSWLEEMRGRPPAHG